MTFCHRLSELELRVLTAETAATEQKAERYATERDLCDGMSGLRDGPGRLDSQVGSTSNALGEALTGLVQEVSLLSANAAAADPSVKSDPWKGECGLKGPPGGGPPGFGGIDGGTRLTAVARLKTLSPSPVAPCSSVGHSPSKASLTVAPGHFSSRPNTRPRAE